MRFPIALPEHVQQVRAGVTTTSLAGVVADERVTDAVAVMDPVNLANDGTVVVIEADSDGAGVIIVSAAAAWPVTWTTVNAVTANSTYRVSVRDGRSGDVVSGPHLVPGVVNSTDVHFDSGALPAASSSPFFVQVDGGRAGGYGAGVLLSSGDDVTCDVHGVSSDVACMSMTNGSARLQWKQCTV